MSVISIDHLPDLLPREASEAFSKDLLPSLLDLKEWRTTPAWAKAEKLFQKKVATYRKASYKSFVVCRFKNDDHQESTFTHYRNPSGTSLSRPPMSIYYCHMRTFHRRTEGAPKVRMRCNIHHVTGKIQSISSLNL